MTYPGPDPREDDSYCFVCNDFNADHDERGCPWRAEKWSAERYEQDVAHAQAEDYANTGYGED